MKRGRSPNEADPRLIAALPKLWAAGVETVDIADRFSAKVDTVRLYAHRLGLKMRDRPPSDKPEMSKAELRRKHMRKVHCLRHRNAIRQPDPIVLAPPGTLFGAPLRKLDAETRALIDAAVDAAQGPRRAYHKRRGA